MQARATLAEKAQEYTDEALAVLFDVATDGESESARVAAACAILDRAHGRPIQATEISGKDGAPIETKSSSFDLERKLAFILLGGLRAGEEGAKA